MEAQEEHEQDSLEDEQDRGEEHELDEIVDEEHVIDEVEVNMEGFNFTVGEKVADPTRVGDDNASIRRRKLRKLRKFGGEYSSIMNNLFTGQEFPNKDEANDKIRTHAFETRRKIYSLRPILTKAEVHVRGDAEEQYALVRDYCEASKKSNLNTTDRLWKCATATTVVEFEKAMDELKGYNKMTDESLRKIPPKHWSTSHFSVKGPWGDQVVVNLSLRTCSCRKREIYGISCKHVVACIFNMAYNGMQVGVREDWVHESMTLQTWRNVYSFKINPICRLGKKRKKSVGEVADIWQQGKARDNKLQVNLPPSASQATPYASPRRTKKTVRITLTK
ncbi:mutator type transposase [Tanacetum coccineum]